MSRTLEQIKADIAREEREHMEVVDGIQKNIASSKETISGYRKDLASFRRQHATAMRKLHAEYGAAALNGPAEE